MLKKRKEQIWGHIFIQGYNQGGLLVWGQGGIK